MMLWELIHEEQGELAMEDYMPGKMTSNKHREFLETVYRMIDPPISKRAITPYYPPLTPITPPRPKGQNMSTGGRRISISSMEDEIVTKEGEWTEEEDE